MEEEGAPVHERVLAAVRSDDEESLLELFKEDKFDINCVDAIGNTRVSSFLPAPIAFLLIQRLLCDCIALHLAVVHGSIDSDVLEHILTHDECDVDPINRIDKATPLHLAVKLETAELRHHFVKKLLEAGAETNIKDKNGDKAEDLIPSGDEILRNMFRKNQSQASFSRGDIANDSDDESGSGSDEA